MGGLISAPSTVRQGPRNSFGVHVAKTEKINSYVSAGQEKRRKCFVKIFVHPGELKETFFSAEDYFAWRISLMTFWFCLCLTPCG